MIPYPKILSIRKLIFFLFIIIILFLPLIYSPITVSYFELPKITFLRLISIVILACILLYYSLTKDGIKKIHLSFLDIPIYLFILILIVSTLFSISPRLSIFGEYYRRNGILALINYIFLFLVISKFKLTPSDIIKLFIAMLIVSFLVSIYGALQHFGLDWQEWETKNPRSFSTLGHPNDLAGFLQLIFPVNLCLLFYQFKFKKFFTHLFKIILFFVLITNYCVILFTYSRSGWIGLLFSLFLWIILMMSLNRKILLENKVYLSLLILLLILLPLSFNRYSQGPGNVTLKERAISSFNLKEPTVNRRLEIWKSVVRAIKDFPIIGSGPETLRLIFPKYRSKDSVRADANILADKAHNKILNIGANLGFLGLFSYLWILTNFFCKSLNCFLNKKINNLSLIALISTIFGYFFFLQFSFSDITNGVFFWLFLGMAVNIIDGGLEIRSQGLENAAQDFSLAEIRSQKLSLKITTLILILSLLLLWLSIKPFLADTFYRQAKIHSYSKRYDKTIFQLKKALSLLPREVHYINSLADIYVKKAQSENNSIDYLKLAFIEYQNALAWEKNDCHLYYKTGVLLESIGNKTKGQKYYLQALKYLNKAHKLYPLMPSYTVALGRVYLSLARDCPNIDKRNYFLNKSLYFYNKNLSLDKNNPQVYYGKGQIFYFQGKFKLALKYLEKAQKIDSKFTDTPDFYTWKGNIYIALNEEEKAIEAYKKALKLKPEFPERIRISLMKAYYQAGKIESAKKEYEKILRLKRK